MLMRKGVGYSYILYIHFLNGTNKFVMCPLFFYGYLFKKIICSYEKIQLYPLLFLFTMQKVLLHAA